MRIESIRVQDYYQFKGDQTVQFPDSSDTNLHMIEGGPGTGKSNLVNSLILCLYGDHGFRPDLWNIANRTVLESLNSNKNIPTKIGTTIKKNGQRYRFGRCVEATQQEDTLHYNVGELRGDIWKDGWSKVDDCVRLRKSTLPLALRPIWLIREIEQMRSPENKMLDNLVEPILNKELWGDESPRDNQQSVERTTENIIAKANDFLSRLTDRVAIDLDNGGIEFVNPVTGRQSYSATGERILAMFTLMLSAGTNTPIEIPQVFDAPFGYLDEKSCKAVLSVLEEEIEHQIIITTHKETANRIREHTIQPASEHRIVPNESPEEVQIECIQ